MTIEPTTPGRVDSIDLLQFLGFVRRRWLWVLGAMLLGGSLALVYLNIATPKYSATLRVSAASSGGGLGGALGQLGGIAAMAGLDLGKGSGSAATPFDLYLDKLRSHANAEELARDPAVMRHIFFREWNETERRWQEPDSLVHNLDKVVQNIAGQPRPPYQPPDADELTEYLADKLGVTAAKPKDPPLTTIVFEDRDPAFAAMLLNRVHSFADDAVRALALRRATENSRFLTGRLSITQNVDQQRSLSEILLDQERQIMMASSSVSFAATPSQPAVTSPEPVRPKVPTTIIAGLLLGALFGLLGLFGVFLARSMRA